MSDQASLIKYNEYDFTTNPNWINYFTNLYPTPSHDQVEKIKRKWYKKNIDTNFQINFDENPNNNSNTSNPSTQQTDPVRANPSQFNTILFKIEGYLKIAFIPGLLLLPGFYLKVLVAVVCLLAITRNFGLPKLNKEYFIKLIPSEFCSNLLYILSISLHSSQNGFLFFLPIAIHLSSGIVEFVNRTNPNWLLINPKIYEMASVIKNNRNALIIAKNKVEFSIFIYLLLVWIFGLSSLFQIIIYLQFLNLKYKFNGNMQTAIWELRNFLVGHPKIPAFAKNIVSKFFELFLKLMNIF